MPGTDWVLLLVLHFKKTFQLLEVCEQPKLLVPRDPLLVQTGLLRLVLLQLCKAERATANQKETVRRLEVDYHGWDLGILYENCD